MTAIQVCDIPQDIRLKQGLDKPCESDADLFIPAHSHEQAKVRKLQIQYAHGLPNGYNPGAIDDSKVQVALASLYHLFLSKKTNFIQESELIPGGACDIITTVQHS